MSCTSFVKRSLLLAVLAVLLGLGRGIAAAQTFTSLASFDGANGREPYYVYMVQGVDGQLYGTTYMGGANGEGSVFEISTGGTIKIIYSFCSLSGCTDGGEPWADLLLASDGNFYGTTAIGGANDGGTVFKMTPTGTLTTLYSFCAQPGCADGGFPSVGLIQASSGILYGTTSGGGPSNDGTVFSIATSGKDFKSLYSFSGSGGQYPDGRLVQGANGNFYGTTYYGDALGTVFEITSAGKLTTLHTFTGADGDEPNDALFLAANGNFYGTTSAGGANNGGTIFEITPGGKFTTLYNFCSLASCADGETSYAGLIQANDGNFYGTTSAGGENGYGTVFQFTSAGKLNTLYSFCVQTSCTDGSTPYEGLVQDTSGILYGTTFAGGTSDYGTVYSESLGLAPFVKTVQPSGKVDSKIVVLGTNLTGATAVSFNGTASTFTVAEGGASINTSVPAGATTGPVSVTMPSGTLPTLIAFKVTPQVTTFTPPSGPVGTPVTITGVSLTQTSKVTFGGVAATSFTVNSDTEVTATVPSGAKTGRIAITTPGGTATSSTSFTVTTP
jgi:uncharacterized repeat protein (TIGR03803 family)